MDVLGMLVVVLAVLASAIAATRRDPRFDRRETLTQMAWIAAYLAFCIALAFVLVPLGRRIGVAAALLIGVVVIAGGMVVLARYLKRRLKVWCALHDSNVRPPGS